MPKKQANGAAGTSSSLSTESNGTPSRSQSSDSLQVPPGPLSVIIPEGERDVIKVNNANVSELKHACDDALKRYLSRPELFKQKFLHTDVKLSLGWAGVAIAIFTGLYGYKVEFEKAKPVVFVGLVLYWLLTGIQTIWAYFVEGDIIFVGKRKTFSKRIITERLSISSKTQAIKGANPPSYNLAVTYVQSSSGGKSLLARGKASEAKAYNGFFDEAGCMNQSAFEQWVGALVEKVMEGRDT